MEYYIRALKKYADFRGTDNREQFWMFFLIHVLITLGLNLITAFMIIFPIEFPLIPLISLIYSLALLIPGLAAGARRLRDAGFNPLLLLVLLIPALGFIILIILWAQPRKAQAPTP